MPGLLLHERASMTCPHGGTVTVSPTQTKVVADRMAVATSDAQITVAGCPFQVPAGTGTKPQPCVTVKWTSIAGRVKVLGKFAMLQPAPSGPGAGICQSGEQIPQGSPTVQSVQKKATGS